MAELTFSTALGACRITWNDVGLTSLRLPEARPEASDMATAPESGSVPPETDLATAPAWVRELVARTREHLAGRTQDFADVPLDWSRVSAFQQAVYRQTAAIKPGGTSTYGAIARALGLGPDGARAVGAALGSNPWPLVVPCHRVVAADGKMTGFSAPGGVRTKVRLLALEGAELALE